MSRTRKLDDPMRTFEARPDDATYYGPPVTPTRRLELLGLLPKATRAILVDLLDGRIQSGAERYRALPACFAEVNYPTLDATAGSLPRELTPAWRALLELSTMLPRLLPSAFGVPTDVWNLRRWLGLDPPGRLERPLPGERVPLWRTLATRPLDSTWTPLRELPLPERLEAFCEGALRAYRLSPPSLGAFGDEDLATPADLEALGAPGTTVAPALADWLVHVANGPDRYPRLGPIVEEARAVVFLALVAAKVPIAPAWDRLFPLGAPGRATLIQAIPPERRARAVVAGAHWMHPYFAEKAIFEVLPLVPDASLVRLLKQLGRDGGGHPKRIVSDTLEALGREHPAVAAILGDQPAKDSLELSVREVPMPATAADLPALRREQVQPADDQLHLYRLFTVHGPSGEHLFDMSLFCWDDGPVYRAGTMKVVARFVQGSADCKDRKLRDALDTALYRFRNEPSPRRTPTAPRKKLKQRPQAKKPTGSRKTGSRKIEERAPAATTRRSASGKRRANKR